MSAAAGKAAAREAAKQLTAGARQHSSRQGPVDKESRVALAELRGAVILGWDFKTKFLWKTDNGRSMTTNYFDLIPENQMRVTGQLQGVLWNLARFVAEKEGVCNQIGQNKGEICKNSPALP
jgi:hypothetical protein